MAKVSVSVEGNQQDRPIFYSGQVVTGQVHVETPTQLKTRGIRVEVIGKGNLSWLDNDTDETYMDYTMYLIGSANLPSSFHGRCGSVTYEIKAVISRKKKQHIEDKVEITVIRLLDLKYERQQLKEPLQVELQNLQSSDNNTWDGGCYIKGVPRINLSLNRGCFTSGETMIVGGQVANRTNTKIDNIVVEFMQQVEFWDSPPIGGNYRPTSSSYDVIASVVKPGVKSGQTQNLDGISFNIPPLVASRLDGCSFINIMYYIQVTIVFSGCCSNSCWVKQDVIIGDIPLHSNTITSQPQGCSLCCSSTEANNRREPMNSCACRICNAGFECTECRQIAVGSRRAVSIYPPSAIN